MGGGAGPAAAGAARGLREGGHDGPVVLVGAEPDPPYDRAALPGALRGAPVPPVHADGWYAAHGVALRLGTEAVALHRGSREVELAGGERLGYDTLLLATGAEPPPPGVPGSGLAGVHRLRTRADAAGLRSALARGGRVLVAGGGWAALEVAAAARFHGALVTLLVPGAAPLHAVLGPELGSVVADWHRGNGVDVRTDAEPAALLDGGAGAVGGARTRAGEELAADLVVLAGGLRPRTALAEAAGLAVGDGVLVDGMLRTSHPGVYAAGEVAAAPNLALGARARVEHPGDAAEQGYAAGLAMAGRGRAWDRVPRRDSEQYGMRLRWRGLLGGAGAGPGYDEVVLRGGEEEGEDDETIGSLLAFWLRAGRVVAGLEVDLPGEEAALERLVRSRARVDPVRLADPGVPLDLLG